MIFGRARLRPNARTAGGASAAAKDHGLVFDRMTALGLGVLLGLTTVVVDRLRSAAAARDEGRGGPAVAKTPIGGVDGLVALARRTLAEFTEDRIPAVAAGATFFILLALFPALGVFVSLYGLMADLGAAQRQIAGLHGLLPAGGVAVLSEQIARLAALPPSSLGLTFLLSLVLSVLSSNAGMKALIAGLNIAYEARERRGFLRVNLVSLAFTAGGIVFAGAAMATVAAVPQLLAWLGLGDLAGLSLLRWPAMLVVTVGVLAVLYRFAPSLENPHWRWITPGSLLATVGWGAMSAAFSAYVARFGHYDRTYGSLGALAGFMTWIWLSLIVVLLGAELNCELERRTQGHGG